MYGAVRTLLAEDTMADAQPFVVTVGPVGTADGSSQVRLGGTCVLCGIKAELTTPAVCRPDEGYLVANVNLSPMCSSSFRTGPPSEEAQSLSQWLHDVWTECELLDVKQLCISPGKLCWVLYEDITCLNYDGSLQQACLAALVTALRNLRLPSVEISEETQRVVRSSDLSQPVRLKCIPTAVSFAVVSDKMVRSPCREEERIASAPVNMVAIDQERLCAITKQGGKSINQSILRQWYQQALAHGEEIRRTINEACSQA